MPAESISALQRKGIEFERTLPHTEAPFSSRAWGHSFHSLCSYQGKLKPALAHWLVRQFTSVGDSVLDPLGGVGTIAFEAGLLGRTAFTSDLSPLASTVARAKVAPPNPGELQADFQEFCAELDDIELTNLDFDGAKFGLNASVEEYYHPNTLNQILRAKRILSTGELSAPRNFIKASLLHILHGNRPYALSRTSHPITPFSPTGPYEFRSLVERLDTRLQRLMGVALPAQFIPGMSWHSDFRRLPVLLPAPIDAIICSPPFPGMRFDRPNWLRMWFCGWDASDFDQTSRGFLERQQGRTFEVYKDFFEVCSVVTKRGAPIILHVGGSKAYDMASHLIALAAPYLRYRGTVTEAVDHIEKHGIKDKGTTSSHMLLLFERI